MSEPGRDTARRLVVLEVEAGDAPVEHRRSAAARAAASDALTAVLAELGRDTPDPEAVPLPMDTDAHGAPRVAEEPPVPWRAALEGVEVHISLTHDGDLAAALVVVQRSSSRASTSGPTATPPESSSSRLAARSSGS